MRKHTLFTGASAASRGFELAVLAAGVALAARTLVAPPGVPVPFFTGLESGLAAALALIVIALAGAFPVPLGNKTFLSLGSGAVFATLLVFSPQQAVPLAFAGTLIAQIVRRHRGYRLTSHTILFNQAQYLVTWGLCIALYFRVRADLVAYPALSWLPVVAAGIVYALVNTWLVSTWNALRKRTWAWDLWIRVLREAGPGYAASLGMGAAVARLAVIQPLWVLPTILGLAGVHWGLSQMSRTLLRQNSAVLAALVDFAERLSPFTVEHSERVTWWAERLARHLDLAEDEIETVAIAAKLHDVGKTMLRHLEEKPGPLTQQERERIEQHPAVGADIIARLPGMETVARFVRYHHERYDGKGYPDGLSGEEIPVGARIIAVADCYDAMLEPRTYRRAVSPKEALAEVVANAGTQFDPRVVTALQVLTDQPAGHRGLVPRFPQVTGALALATAGAGATLPSTGSAAGWIPDDANTRPGAMPQALSQRLVAAVEAERRHIARELHDEIGQALAGLKLALETVPRLPAQTAGTRLQEARATINELMTRVHNFSLDLRPAMLDDLGLLPTLLWHVERYMAQTGVHVEFEHAGLDRRMRPEVETTAYRIAQEALTNVARHAGVSEVRMRVWIDAGMLHVQVTDRGKGFDAEGSRSAGGRSGLVGMHERALQVGGHLRIESAPGKGARVTAALPLSTSAAERPALDSLAAE